MLIASITFYDVCTILLVALAQSLLLELLYDLLQILVHWLRSLTSHPSNVTRGEASLSSSALRRPGHVHEVIVWSP